MTQRSKTTSSPASPVLFEGIDNFVKGVIDNIPDIVFIKDISGKYIHVNQKFAIFIGKPLEKIIGATDADLLPASKSDYFSAEDQRLVTTLLVQKNVDWSTFPDGKKVLIETVKSPILDDNGHAIGIFGVGRDITERQDTVFTINEKVAEIDNFFRISTDPLLETDFNGSIIKANHAWQTILGYDQEEILSKTFTNYLQEEDIAIVEKALQDGIHYGSPIEFSARLKAKDGSVLVFEWHGQFENGRYFLASRDITRRLHDDAIKKQQQLQLAFRSKFEETLTAISTKLIDLPMDQVNHAIDEVLAQIGLLIDVDRSYVFLLDNQNQTMTNTHEWSAAGIEPEKDNLVGLPQSVFPWWMDQLLKLNTINVPIVSELPMAASAEREILEMQGIQSVLVLPLTTNKDLIGFLGFDSVKKQVSWSLDSIILLRMVSDIISNTLTRFSYQKELAQSESRKTALLLAVPDLIFRCERNGLLVDHNHGSDQSLNDELDDYDPKYLQDLAIEGDKELLSNAIIAAMETRELQTVEFRFESEATMRVLEARILFSAEGEVTAIVRDISDRARLEQIKSDFINKATHELRTPIATMLLMSNLIDGATSESERAEYWEILKSELEHEKTLVDDILTAGKMDSPQTSISLRQINVTDMFSGFITKMELLAKEKGVRLHTNIKKAPELTNEMFNTDEGVLNQILGNLLNNAIKFTPSGGQVNVRMELKPQWVTFTVSDTGIGIPPEDVPFLFSRFFRGGNAIQNQIQGTGIGLYIVKSLVEKLGGTVKATSKLNKGTEFVVQLPNNL